MHQHQPAVGARPRPASPVQIELTATTPPETPVQNEPIHNAAVPPSPTPVQNEPTVAAPPETRVRHMRLRGAVRPLSPTPVQNEPKGHSPTTAGRAPPHTSRARV
jgi:hypothetical protein